jgi:hypothetical protein
MGLMTLVYVIRQAFNRQAGEIGGWERARAHRRSGAHDACRRIPYESGPASPLSSSASHFWRPLGRRNDQRPFADVHLLLNGLHWLHPRVADNPVRRSLSVEIVSKESWDRLEADSRWQIVAGKWIGVMTLNITL